MIDCHVHSTFSPDSNITFGEAVESVRKVGLEGVIFTDHYEFDYALTSFNLQFDLKERELKLNKLQAQYDGVFKIFKGLEVGIHPKSIKKLGELVTNSNLDFVIASVHQMDGFDLGFPDFYQNKSKKESFTRYLEGVLYSVSNFKNYDVVGHIGYVRRYIPAENKSMNYADYADLIDAIFKKIIETGKGIEVNTSGLRQGLETPIPSFDILNRYFELGGRVLTLGSDSHSAATIGHNFKTVAKQLKSIGFKQAAYFSKRNPVFYDL